MNQEELAPHIQELKKVLKDNATEEQIAKELDNYVNKYRQDIEVAKRSIIRKLGDETTGFISAENVVKKIEDLTGNEMSVDIVANVLFSQKKTISGKNGPRDIISGTLGDETGTVSFTDWSGNAELEKGKTYRFKNCYTKTWNDRVQINFGNKSTIEPSDVSVKVKEREFTPGPSVSKKIDELDGTERSVDILAKIVYSEVKDIQTKDGNKRTIISGILGDETGTVSFTLWDDHPVLEKDSVYEFKNCYTRKWNDDVQVNIGNNGTVQKSERTVGSVPTRQRPVTAPTELRIGDIREGSGNVTVVGRILSVEKRDIEGKNGPRTVYSGTMADDSGEIQFSAWNDFGLEAGKSYRVTNAYIRSWKGIPQINMGDNSEVSTVNVVFDDARISHGNERTAGDIAKNGGGMDVIIRGVVVDIRPGSGIIKRCPQCNRTIINNECKSHGTVEPVPDLRMRIIIDDGTGSIATTMNREYTEKFTGVTFDVAFNLSKARGEDIVVKELGDKLYLKHLKVRGNAMIDEYGLKINAKEMSIDDVDVKKGAKELLDEVEEALS